MVSIQPTVLVKRQCLLSLSYCLYCTYNTMYGKGRSLSDQPLEVSGRLMGGTLIEASDVPWHATVISTKTKDVVCGASFITDVYLLSAAHCFGNKEIKLVILV